MNLALTGPIGAGKSCVLALLAESLGAGIIDADALCKQLLEPQQPGWQQVRATWGERFIAEDGRITRKKLREALVDSSEVRDTLENILHPLVRHQIVEVLQAKDETAGCLLAEIPLLYEKGWTENFDAVVVVYAPETVCIQRAAARDGVSEKQVENLLGLQMSGEEKAAQADFVIDNSGTWAATVLQVVAVVRQLVVQGQTKKLCI